LLVLQIRRDELRFLTKLENISHEVR